uniref:Uncharacterized protein n=1 Tax=Parascaris equorum TaxID=6256 RepID=A0A914S972_PAREQ
MLGRISRCAHQHCQWQLNSPSELFPADSHSHIFF